MHHLVAAAEVGVLVRERVEAVRAARDDLRHARVVQRRRRSSRANAWKTYSFPARLAGSPGARLARAEDRDVEPGGEQQLRRRDRRRPRPLVERRGAADPVEDLRRRIARLEDANAEAVRPRRPLGLRLAPGIRAALDVAQHRLGIRGKPRLDHDEVAAEVDDVVDVLDRDRALLDARAAGDAVPDDVVRDRVRDERLRARRRPGAALPSAKSWSRIPMIRSFGDRAFPVAYAGQTSWQRPHSVQDIASSICFQVRSATVPAPNRSAASSSTSKSSGSRRPPARVRPKKTLIAAVAMCRCFECGR